MAFHLDLIANGAEFSSLESFDSEGEALAKAESLLRAPGAGYTQAAVIHTESGLDLAILTRGCIARMDADAAEKRERARLNAAGYETALDELFGARA